MTASRFTEMEKGILGQLSPEFIKAREEYADSYARTCSSIPDGEYNYSEWAKETSFKFGVRVTYGDPQHLQAKHGYRINVGLFGTWVDRYTTALGKVGEKVSELCAKSYASVELAPYPVCCALYQANDFSLGANLTDEEVSEIFDAISLAAVMHLGYKAKRLVFNFVESGDRGLSGDRPLRPAQRQALVLKELPKATEEQVENRMSYPGLYRWAKKQKGFQELEYYNANSGNIIHTAMVIPSINFPKE